MKPYFFVLGAPDHEMQEIARVCKERDLKHSFATIGGHIVHSHDAYNATGVNGVIPADSHLIFVECSVMGLTPDTIVDHHHPGDPGFGVPPEQYLEGSSIGQFLRFLGLKPTPQQLVIAAADHCLTSAYSGRCPGVSPTDLAAWRLSSRCKARGLSEVELSRQIDCAKQLLVSAQQITLAGEQVAFLTEPPIEVSEASARMGMPYMYIRRQDARLTKAGIRSAPAHVVQAWMDNCGLQNLYGDPQRGFAGGYFINTT